jgi:hypoxanthine phosphoribosyltransferase
MSRIPKQDEIDNVISKASCLFTLEQVDMALDELASKLTDEFANKNPVILTVMTGGMLFSGRLLPRLNFPLEVDYLHVTRYQAKMVGERVRWLVQPLTSLIGRHVVIIDDIHDVGATLDDIVDYCSERGARSISTVALVNKNHDRKISEVDYSALDVPDKFIFGCGMDYFGYWRNAPGIFALDDI